MDDSGVQQQIVIVENGVNYSISHNDLKVTSEAHKNFEGQVGRIDDQKKGYESLAAMRDATTEEGQWIQSLKETEESALSKGRNTTRVLSICCASKTNVLKFDAHMTGMEETHRNIHKGAEIRLVEKEFRRRSS